MVAAIFRRVPGRIEAENYGQEGLGKSFFVKDTTKKATSYRTSEPVPMELIDTEGNRRRSGQGIRLGAEEWTAYTVHSLKSREYAGVVKVKAETAPTVIQLSVDDLTNDLSLAESGWVEIKINTLRFNEGANRIQLSVKRGAVCVDWLDFE